ncbi:hypothetical protein HYPBUDRAFT_95042, partial [Hyphopichia burtonii NRRL Y-1933]
MSVKDSAVINVGYPIYGSKFINNKTLVTIGGGGEGKNGIPNKITAIKCSFKAEDKNRRLQRFREIELPANEDCPMCLDVAKIPDDDSEISITSNSKSNNYNVFFGCNQSSQLIKSMNINNNIRKYVFTQNEHLQFIDGAQFDDNITNESVGEYPKIIALSPNSSVGCFMTSAIPSSICVFKPDTLDITFKFTPEKEVEIKDFHLSPNDDGKTLCYITSNSIETFSTVTGNVISSTSSDPAITKILNNFILSKVRFIDNSNVIVTGGNRGGKPGASIFQFNLAEKKIVKRKQISSKVRGIVALDFNLPKDLIAMAGNDFSVILVRLSDFKNLKVFTKLHDFAVTTLSFSPNGLSLATGSASNSLLVLKLPPNFAKGKSTIGTILNYLILTIFIALLGIFL